MAELVSVVALHNNVEGGFEVVDEHASVFYFYAEFLLYGVMNVDASPDVTISWVIPSYRLHLST